MRAMRYHAWMRMDVAPNVVQHTRPGNPDDRHGDKLLTAEDVADRLRVHHSTVRRYAAEGVIPSVRLAPGPRAPLRFRPADIDRYINNLAEAAG
jgi:excisionase family DNA binding protein